MNTQPGNDDEQRKPIEINLLRTAVPCLVYGILSWQGWIVPAVLSGLVGMALSWAPAWRRAKSPDFVVLLAFAMMFMVLVFFGEEALESTRRFVLPGLLGLLSFGSLLIGHPFTLQYAREYAQPEFWGNPHFHLVNRILTAMWGIVFLMICALLGFKAEHPEAQWIFTWLLPLGLTGAAFWLTQWFPLWYRRTIYLRSSNP